MNFKEGDAVIYMREKFEEIAAYYVAEVQFSWKERRHQIMIDDDSGSTRFVSAKSLRAAVPQ